MGTQKYYDEHEDNENKEKIGNGKRQILGVMP